MKVLLGRPKLKGVGKIKMDLEEIGWKGVDWINLAEGTDKWEAVCEHGNKLWFP
jgi:hypothetical protein